MAKSAITMATILQINTIKELEKETSIDLMQLSGTM